MENDQRELYSITLHESSERVDTLDTKELMSPPWEKERKHLSGGVAFEPRKEKPSYEPPDRDYAQSKHLEKQITALALEHGASWSEDTHEKLDWKRRLQDDPNAHKKGYLFGDLAIHDHLVRNVVYLVPIGGGAAVLIKAVKDLLLQWLKNKGTRTIQIQKGDVSVSVTGENDFQKALEMVERLKQRPKPRKTMKTKAGSKATTSHVRGKNPRRKSASTEKESTNNQEREAVRSSRAAVAAKGTSKKAKKKKSRA